MARFAEGLELVTRLLRDEEPVTFDGEYFQMREAKLLPRPERPGGPRLLIGGNGAKWTLPLAARYADVWNALFMPAEDFHALSAQLDELLRAAGRKQDDALFMPAKDFRVRSRRNSTSCCARRDASRRTCGERLCFRSPSIRATRVKRGGRSRRTARLARTS